MNLQKLRIMLWTMLIRKQLTSNVVQIQEVDAGEVCGLPEDTISITFCDGKIFDITIKERK